MFNKGRAKMDEFLLWVADQFLAPCASPAYAGYNVSDLVLRFSKEMAKAARAARLLSEVASRYVEDGPFD
jgi:hypothetical protein